MPVELKRNATVVLPTEHGVGVTAGQAGEVGGDLELRAGVEQAAERPPRPSLSRPAVGAAEALKDTRSPGWMPIWLPPVGLFASASPLSESWALTVVVAAPAGLETNRATRTATRAAARPTAHALVEAAPDGAWRPDMLWLPQSACVVPTGAGDGPADPDRDRRRDTATSSAGYPSQTGDKRNVLAGSTEGKRSCGRRSTRDRSKLSDAARSVARVSSPDPASGARTRTGGAAATRPAVGAHVDRLDPVGAAAATGADAVQFFLTDPQAWKAPDRARRRPRRCARATSSSTSTRPTASTSRRRTTASGCRAASCSPSTRRRPPGSARGRSSCTAGTSAETDDPSIGVDNWRKTFEYAHNDGGYPLPVLIENTAGGTNAVARRFDRLARLWDVVGDLGAGFCLDTCHAHAGGEDLSGIVDRVLAITGRIDLVHANDSRDAFDSGADRHANFGAGSIDPSVIADVCRAAGSDVIVETPGGPSGQGADIDYLRSAL